MSSSLPFIVAKAATYLANKIEALDRNQMIRIGFNGYTIFYFSSRLWMGKRLEAIAWFALGFFMGILERRNNRTEMINLISWDVDTVVASRNPVLFAWFPILVSGNYLFDRFSGRSNAMALFEAVFSIRAGVAAARFFRGDVSRPRAENPF